MSGVVGNPSKTGKAIAGDAILSRDPVVEALFTAEELISYGAWTQGALARDASGRECSVDAEEGAQYSLEGALLVATAYGPPSVYERAESYLTHLLPPWAANITMYNDAEQMKVSGVKALITDAIKLAKKENTDDGE